jgi:hypothetical protein
VFHVLPLDVGTYLGIRSAGRGRSPSLCSFLAEYVAEVIRHCLGKPEAGLACISTHRRWMLGAVEEIYKAEALWHPEQYQIKHSTSSL